MTKTASFAAAAACAFFAVAAHAMPAPGRTRIELVNYADLDLGSKVDRARLKWQIHLAAMRVCAPERFLALSCYDTAIADALKQLNRAIAEHNKKTSSVAATHGSAGYRNRAPGHSSDR